MQASTDCRWFRHDFWKGLLIADIFIYIVYMVMGLVVYSAQGQYAFNPALAFLEWMYMEQMYLQHLEQTGTLSISNYMQLLLNRLGYMSTIPPVFDGGARKKSTRFMQMQ